MEKTGESEIFAISADQPFNFGCGPLVSCFNACCRDLNQYLSPYDVLRLKKNLGISSSEFLKTFTKRHDGPESGLPVVTITPGAAPDLKCPFVSPQGCMVYDDRPASCRMYPVMRMAGRDRITGKVRTRYMLIHEPHCHGFNADNALTVDQWMEGQGVLPYNTANDGFLQILAVKREKCPGVLPREIADRVFNALYDSDRYNMEISVTVGDGNDENYLRAAYDYVIRLLSGS
jgi:uncharacterized protein